MMKNKKIVILLIGILAALLLALFLTRQQEAPRGADTTAPSRQHGAEQTQPQTFGVPDDPDETSPSQAGASDTRNDPETEPTSPPQTLPPEEQPVTPDAPLILDEGLRIELVGAYSGMYVEDGSGEIVEDIMMILLRNSSDQDLQLARIELAVQGETYSFECTDLPAGEAAVLLETDRRAAVEARPEQAQITLSVFFDSPMETAADVLRVEGARGTLTVTNVSDRDITGDIYVYYKFHEAGCYYGGITFRVAVRGGLAAGESSQLIAGHYDPDTCRIVQVTYGS